jgi:hypothetical protein
MVAPASARAGLAAAVPLPSSVTVTEYIRGWGGSLQETVITIPAMIVRAIALQAVFISFGFGDVNISINIKRYACRR